MIGYFEALLDLLSQERQVDKNLFTAATQSTTVVQRRTSGMCWYPIVIKGQEMGYADYLTIELERPSHTEISHQFRFGGSAQLFSNLNPDVDYIEGVIAFVSGNKMKLSFKVDELPEWASDGKLGVQVLFDDNSYDEMEKALQWLIKSNLSIETQRIVDVLIGRKEPTFNRTVQSLSSTTLNESQNQAVNLMLAAEDVAIVHGPPGTGKTSTLIQGINALLAQGEEQILVVAPSNAAVDLLSEQLANVGHQVVRIGNPSKVSDHLLALTLDHQIQQHSTNKEIRKLKKRANEFRDMAHKYKRNFGKAEREQRKALFDEAHKILKDVEHMEQYIIKDILGKTQIVAATLVGANHYTIRQLKYNVVVIDEAAQALEPACWIPIIKAQKVIFAGDHCQLPPTIKSQQAGQAGLSITLFEKCIQLIPNAAVLLDTQYRMHEQIMGFSSKQFYNGLLKAHESNATHYNFTNDKPIEFIDTAGCGFEETTDQKSIANPEEAALLLQLLLKYYENWELQKVGKQPPTSGVIAPYKDQIYALNDAMANNSGLQRFKGSIVINTIDSFQGQEKDIIYISMTRSNSDGTIGFLKDYRRMNVAMTRARKKLVVIGDSATLSRNTFYDQFIKYCEQHNAYSSAWEYMNT